MIFIGTSGFSYEDWKGYFYPEGIKKSDMLACYARQFPAVEVNSTYYAIPGPASFYAMAKKTPEGFKFAVKAHKDMTHAEETNPEVFGAFRRAIEPLQDEGKLGCVLAQYPWSFKPSDESRDRLVELKEQMQDIPTVVEFRNSSWTNDETFEMLRELDLGFCSVDEPGLKGLMPRIAVATSKVGYVRFHGRNASQWWKHDEAWQRYNYLYSEDELIEWVPKVDDIERQTDVTYIFFNNHYQGKAAQNAAMFAKMLALPFGNIEPEQPRLFD